MPLFKQCSHNKLNPLWKPSNSERYPLVESSGKITILSPFLIVSTLSLIVLINLISLYVEIKSNPE